ncbi:MAG TPA: heavy metal translocating P-type ATPase [Xanthobacteraceae bacterium]|nr:heavy metal translocating P-type ATPase [Xanthobacteraceae bacterium]
MAEIRDLSHFVHHLDGGLARMELAVDGIVCGACMRVIEGGLAAIPDITLARVNLSNRRVAVEWRDGKVDPVRLIDRLSELGYRAYPYDASRAAADVEQETRKLLRCLGVAAFAAMNIMLLSVAVWSGNASDISPEQRDFFHWLSALIALPAAAYAGRPFFHSALRAVATRRLNMDVPISIGVLLALGMSVIETSQHATHAYFDSALMLLAFLLAGRTLEQAMRRRTRAVAGNLAALRAETATRFIGPDELAVVPVASIRPGDIVLVRPGERIAVDGVVTEGRSEVDQSLVTGETLPISASKGSMVYAGTLNLSGTLRVKVSVAERGTLLDEVTRILDHALEARTHYVRLADRAARLYAPLVHATAFTTMIGWIAFGATLHDAIITAIAVLIITCPCALGLAVPAVQVVASGSLFRAGVLLNSGEGIERLAGVDTILFDKTGTLTLPEPEVINAADLPADRLVLAGRLALASRHPLAAAVARAARAKAPLAAVEEPGQGVRCECEGVELRLGRPSFCGVECAAQSFDADPEASAIAFAYGGERYVLAVRQRLRGDAAEVIAKLKRGGFRIEILSGDRASAVAHAAHMLGVEHWHAGMTPADKIVRIAALQSQGRNVLMVGDGLNDAPSLAAADASLSVATAAHLAQAAADAIFLGDRLTPVTAAIAIARRARQLMRENLLLAIAYNAVAVPIAIFGFASPLVAALAMSSSSILVTVNALRAKPREPDRWKS